VSPEPVVGWKEWSDGRVVVVTVVLLHDFEHNDGLSGFSIGTLLPDALLYHLRVDPPATGSDWIGLSGAGLPTESAAAWVVQPDCGAVVVFVGTVRDHAEGRPGVVALDYEAYAEQAEPRMATVAAEARTQFPGVARIAILHRTGPLAVTDAAVVVAVSAPHRGEAFDAARFCIDTVKATVPIWKKESWADGEDWGTDATPVMQAEGRR
jgi:molybdopterin synthase catalytic subunit